MSLEHLIIGGYQKRLIEKQVMFAWIFMSNVSNIYEKVINAR